ncbi:MAG: hypothetical protein GXO26_04605 [Crenarchaeota archaeon]|nr:hypothetical protein [Thermoproteota archaeon]
MYNRQRGIVPTVEALILTTVVASLTVLALLYMLNIFHMVKIVTITRIGSVIEDAIISRTCVRVVAYFPCNVTVSHSSWLMCGRIVLAHYKHIVIRPVSYIPEGRHIVTICGEPNRLVIWVES